MIRYQVNQGVHKLKSKTKRTLSTFSVGIASLGLILAMAPGLANASTPNVVYDALPSVSPQTNYPSQPFQAQQTDEFGDSIHLGGTDRVLNNVTVTMSDWALYSDYTGDARYLGNSTSWTHPITLNVYSTHLDANGVPDQKLATVTQDISIPWRPAPDTCDATGWTDSGGHCNHGLAFNATFDLSSLNVTLPDDVIVSLAYNTQTWGYSPIGTPGPYNSLNVAIPDNQSVSVGSDNNTDAAFWNTHTCSYYTDGGAAGCNVLREDTGWTPNGTVALKITATSPVVAHGQIIKPKLNHHYTKSLVLKATYDDGDVPNTDDIVQWAVRKGTCAANTGTVYGNVDGHSDAYNWDGNNFKSTLDIRAADPGQYCFVFNPKDDAGQPDVRLTRTFYIDAYVPHDKKDCKKGGWQDYLNPSFRNQGQCIKYVEHHTQHGHHDNDRHEDHHSSHHHSHHDSHHHHHWWEFWRRD